MKALVVYDSAYGNTQRVAEAIAATLAVEATHSRAAAAGELEGIDLLVAGSPTQGGRPTKVFQEYLRTIPNGRLDGVAVAAFDTRIPAADSGLPLRLLMNLIGYAAPRIAADLKRKGGRQVIAPEGFVVEGKEGPLREGELERARGWAKQLQETIASVERP